MVFLVAAGAAGCGLLLAVGLSARGWLGSSDLERHKPAKSGVTAETVQVQQINVLKTLPPEKRTARLEAIARKEPDTQKRNRARYLLASERLQQGQAQKALDSLNGLEKDYPLLAAQVLLKRAQAYQQMGDTETAKATWQELLRQHPDNPLSVEALVALGEDNPTYWQQAIARFPAHPRSVDLARQQLKHSPNDFASLLLVAKYGLHVTDYLDGLDRLVKQHSPRLTPKDWEAIAFGYWEKQEYGKAGEAYARAPQTARNAYRIARGLQLGGKPGATVAYQRMVQNFADAPETSLALLRLSRLVDSTSAIAYLDQILRRFPARAGEALLEKAKLLDQMGSKDAAAQTRRSLLSRYGTSESAAELRWTLAQQSAAAHDLQAAITWAEPILTNNPDSDHAPEAGFWLGKWATQQGKRQVAKTAFERVLKQYPQSYYAWRSASMLGWDVGDFSSLRQLNPAVERPSDRPQLTAGSETLQELYQLGQDRDAWNLWQVEFANKMQPTVAEQFTDGVMRLGVGDYLDGIFMVSFLSERDTPEEQKQYQELRRNLAYWQSLYPFPFLEPIETWSQERQLNPLLVTALIRQESRFMPGIKSSAGAIGLMQVMPDTGEWIAEKIKLKQYDLTEPDDNLKLGTWYLDYTHAEYQDNSMLAVASYNAGPGAVAGWVTRYGVADSDHFVETIPYDETRGYVKSVFENYWNYLRLYNPEIAQKLAQLSEQSPQS